MSDPLDGAAAVRCSRARVSPALWIAFGLGLFSLLGVALAAPHVLHRGGEWRLLGPVALAATGAGLLFARWPRAEPVSARVILLLAFASAVLLAYTAAAVWPNSGDEYGYLYAARTMLAGRFYNPPPPDADLFSFYWIGIRDGKMASQYAPGWPLFLIPFQAAHLAPLANPVLLLALGALLLACLKLISTPAAARGPLLALVLLAPFTLFNAASLFSHMLAAVAVLGTCWLVLRDEERRQAWNWVGVGAFLSLALITRIEVGFVTTAVLAVDQLIVRRLQAFRVAIPTLLGALPLILFCMAYNAAITGSPFYSTMAWATPTAATLGLPSLRTLFDLQSTNLFALMSFASAALIPLYLWAVWVKLRARALRFYDFLFPALVLFFVFYPQDPVHQYGPRYWFAAWPAVALTIGSAWPDKDGFVRLPGWRVHLPTLALFQAAAYFSFTLAFAVFLRIYVDARRQVYAATPPATPAVILIPTRFVTLTSLQPKPYWAGAKDLDRNDLDFRDPILYARGDLPDAVQRACAALPARHVFVWEEPGTLRAASCPPV